MKGNLGNMADSMTKESSTLDRIVSRMSSLSGLYEWWIGEDQQNRTQGRVTVSALTDAISVELPTQIVSPGEQLQGSLRVETSGSQGNQRVLLGIKGVEHVFLKRRSIFALCFFPCFRKTESETKSPLDVTCIAHQGDPPLEHGIHTFPFTFNVPRLPASFYDETNEYIAAISYCLVGKFDPTDKSNTSNRKPVAASQPFTVLHTPSNVSRPTETVYRINASERVRMKVISDKGGYAPGDSVQLRVTINSTAVQPIEVVSVSLDKKLTIRAGKRVLTRTTTIWTKEFPGTEPCWFGERWLIFQLPIELPLWTARGNLISCDYVLKVSCTMRKRGTAVVNVPIELTSVPSVAHPETEVTVADVDTRFRPKWQPDESAKNCKQCKRRFVRLFVGRHHCRHCGRVFCVWCCKRYTNITHLGYHSPVRVCDACFPIACRGGTAYVADDGHDTTLSPSPRLN